MANRYTRIFDAGSTDRCGTCNHHMVPGSAVIREREARKMNEVATGLVRLKTTFAIQRFPCVLKFHEQLQLKDTEAARQ